MAHGRPVPDEARIRREYEDTRRILDSPRGPTYERPRFEGIGACLAWMLGIQDFEFDGQYFPPGPADDSILLDMMFRGDDFEDNPGLTRNLPHTFIWYEGVWSTVKWLRGVGRPPLDEYARGTYLGE